MNRQANLRTRPHLFQTLKKWILNPTHYHQTYMKDEVCIRLYTIIIFYL